MWRHYLNSEVSRITSSKAFLEHHIHALGQEIEALRQAIAILSGSDFAVFLEK